MKTLFASLLLGASLAAAAPVYAQEAAAPAYCGGPAGDDDYEVAANDVSTCEVDPAIADAGNALGIVRNETLLFGIVPRPVMTTIEAGTWVDVEADPAGAAQPITRYEYSPDYRQLALRELVTLASGDNVIRVVKDGRAWNEGPDAGFNPEDVADANIVALRKARLLLSPHGIVRAAAFAAKGLCPDNDSQNSDEVLACADNSVTVNSPTSFTAVIDGNSYEVTLGEEGGITGYPTSIAVNVNGMEIVRSFSGYHDGKGTGDDDSAAVLLLQQGAGPDEIAAATAVHDEFRYGVYYPTKITETVNGNTTLDVAITSGWTNRWVPFPDPELLRSVASN